ncbi:FkbM family methyltransferase [Roseibium sp. SCPC15]|uniref:FkbM family methyltransferase n=1 Tax=Roseibium sp. SCP15 TaxID=3141376 RepID=UPI0033384BE9
MYQILKVKRVNVGGFKLNSDRNFIPKDLVKFLYDDSYEKDERYLVEKYLDKSDRVLEIGAGIGLVSLTCARIVGTKNIVSYEPNPGTQDIIKQNFALNRLIPQLRARAVAPDSGKADFYFADNIISSSLFNRDLGTKQTVECDSLIEVLEELRSNVIVMDVEGAEVDLLGRFELPFVNKIIVEVHPHVVGHEGIEAMAMNLKEQRFILQEEKGKCHVYLRARGKT